MQWKYKAERAIWRNFHANEFFERRRPVQSYDTTCNFASSTSTAHWWNDDLLSESIKIPSLVTANFFFEVTPVFYFSDDNCLLAKRPTHFFFFFCVSIVQLFGFQAFFVLKVFFGTYNVHFNIASNFFRISTFQSAW